VVHFGGFFAKLGYFAWFSQYNFILAGRNSKIAIGEAGSIIFEVPTHLG
jgi:hypothetical protein